MMVLTKEGVYEFISENDVKFIRLAFTDVFGTAKNISIMTSQLSKALDYGISIDASAIRGFGSEEKSDLFLIPDISTLSLLPWRPNSGRVARFYCNVIYPDGKPFELDGRQILNNAINELKALGIRANFGAECEFYLFKKDEAGNPTRVPFDNASYLAIAPDDKGENVRREICLTLENMSIIPESSHHEEGPGQNEIDFRYSSPLHAADDLMTVKTVVSTIAENYGLYASFMPKPLEGKSGSGLHINISLDSKDNKLDSFMAGILKEIKNITLFLNSTENSYKRLGEFKAPKYITWSKENRTDLIRIPAIIDPDDLRFELRSPDPMLNPYIAYALLIYAGIEGIKNDAKPSKSINLNLYNASKDVLSKLEKLPNSYSKAYKLAANSDFIRKYLPSKILDVYKNGKR